MVKIDVGMENYPPCFMEGFSACERGNMNGAEGTFVPLFLEGENNTCSVRLSCASVALGCGVEVVVKDVRIRPYSTIVDVTPESFEGQRCGKFMLFPGDEDTGTKSR